MIIISDYSNVINIVLKYGNKSDLNLIFFITVNLQILLFEIYLKMLPSQNQQQ